MAASAFSLGTVIFVVSVFVGCARGWVVSQRAVLVALVMCALFASSAESPCLSALFVVCTVLSDVVFVRGSVCVVSACLCRSWACRL